MDILTVVFGIAVLIFSAVAHEVAHGVMAVRLGDPTPRLMGRITMNPIKHLSWWGSVILPALLIFFQSPIIFGWAKPVPFNPNNIRNKRWGPAQVALAGPVMNICIALVFALIAWVLVWTGVLTLSASQSPIALIIGIVIITNISLAFFNMIPLPPLDGHYVLYALLPAQWRMKLERIRGQSIIFTLIAVLLLWQLFFPLVLITYSLITPVPLSLSL